MTTTNPEEVLFRLARNRFLAHQFLFRHRHPAPTPDFHREIIDLWHGPIPRVLVMAFRNAGKSSLAEEAFIIGASFKLFQNAIIVGATEKRACERLRAIKHEIEQNDLLLDIFGYQVGQVWNEAEIILRNGVRIIAVGRGQSLRGTKHLHYRPDFAFLDDIEDKEHIVTPEARDQTEHWLIEELLPALDKNARVRMNATPLDRDSLPMRIKKLDAWQSRTYPIEYVDDKGQHKATWESLYPLSWINDLRHLYEQSGDLPGFAREYLCVAEDPRAKVFTSSILRVVPKTRTWEPVYAMYDPARTTKETSSTTGWVVFSWVGSRLIVWDAGAELWKPDEIIGHLFSVAVEYGPVEIGIEQDGLHEFIMQPLRAEQIRRNLFVPIRPMKAPQGKIQFIGQLQPYFVAGECTFAKPLPELERQLLSFPTGKIDAPNALAYAPALRGGVPVYDDFASSHVFEKLNARSNTPLWLCLNAGLGVVTGVVTQFVQGAVHVLADYVSEGEPGAVLAAVVSQAKLDFGETRLVAGPAHFGNFDRLGLRGAVARLPAELRQGGESAVGRGEIRELFRRQVRGETAFRIAHAAKWTLNGLSAGYTREIDKHGRVKEEARDNAYRILIEGLEAWTALLRFGNMAESPPNMRTTDGGQRYVSALPTRTPVNPAKDDFLRPDAVSDLSAFTARRQ